MDDKKKIILYPNAERDIGYTMTERVIEMLRKRGRLVVFCPVFENEATTAATIAGLEATALKDELPFAEMIMTLAAMVRYCTPCARRRIWECRYLESIQVGRVSSRSLNRKI